MTTSLVDFVRAEASPSVDQGFTGIAARIESVSSHGSIRSLHLHGLYRVTVDQARDIGAVPLQKALVVTVTSGLRFRAFSLLEETIAFEDDEHIGGGMVLGYFNADLTRRFALDPYATGYVVVSLGPLVSNVAAFTAT